MFMSFLPHLAIHAIHHSVYLQNCPRYFSARLLQPHSEVRSNVTINFQLVMGSQCTAPYFEIQISYTGAPIPGESQLSVSQEQ